MLIYLKWSGNRTQKKYGLKILTHNDASRRILKEISRFEIFFIIFLKEGVMNLIRVFKNIFYPLRNIFIRSSGIFGVMSVIFGGFGLFLSSQNKVLYLIFSLIGYVVVISSLYFNFLNMNHREIKSLSHLKRK